MFLERRLCGIQFLWQEDAPPDEIIANAGLEAFLTTQKDEELIKAQQPRAQGKLAKELPPIAMSQEVGCRLPLLYFRQRRTSLSTPLQEQGKRREQKGSQAVPLV